jgi:hypothetical protein
MNPQSVSLLDDESLKEFGTFLVHELEAVNQSHK